MKRCDLCGQVSMSVMRSKLRHPDVKPRGRCGCNYFCEPCRSLLIEAMQ